MSEPTTTTNAEVDRLIDELFARPDDEGLTLAVLVQRAGNVVGERYGLEPSNPFEPDKSDADRTLHADSTLLSWSMAKSTLHAAVGILHADGKLDPEAPAAVPEWAGTDKSAIRLIDLLEMRDGLDFIEDYVDGDTSHCIEMLFGESGPSHSAYVAARPLAHAPGTRWNYSSGTSNIVSRIIGDVIVRDAAGPVDAPGDVSVDVSVDRRRELIEAWYREHLFGPAGMTSAVPKFDDAGDYVGSSFLYATARDFAKFGELYRNDGVANHGVANDGVTNDDGGPVRVLPSGWADHARHQVATDAEAGFGYGRHWWLWPGFPGSLACHGYEGQRIVVVPDREVVLVHLGKTPVEAAPQLDRRLTEIILAA